jgi:type IV pilus assembly protein PilB
VSSKKRIDKPLGEILVDREVITKDQLEKALLEQKKDGGLIGDTIVKLGFAQEEDIAHCLSLQYGFPYLPLENYEIPKEVVNVIPKAVAEHYCIIPIDKMDNMLTVAMADPLNIHAIEDIEEITGCEIQIFVSTSSDVRKSIDLFF